MVNSNVDIKLSAPTEDIIAALERAIAVTECAILQANAAQKQALDWEARYDSLRMSSMFVAVGLIIAFGFLLWALRQ